MPPRKSVSEAYKTIGELLTYNVALLPEEELVDDTSWHCRKPNPQIPSKILSLF
jgi:hypothetical protein